MRLKIGIQKFKLLERKNKKMLSTIRKYASCSVEGLQGIFPSPKSIGSDQLLPNQLNIR
jgi:hypothetical protein